MYSQKLVYSRNILILLQAICQAETDKDFKDIFDATCGILFLGTPHQGSDASFPRLLVALLTNPFFGSNAILLRLLQKHSTELSSLRQKFSQTISRIRDSHTRLPFLYAFIETKDTFLFNFISLGRVRTLALLWIPIPLPLISTERQLKSIKIIQV
jgi:hypothetical protein